MPKHIQKVKATELMVKRAKEAYDTVQYACNGCGLAQSFAEVFREILTYTDGTAAANQHPIIVLWLDKLCSLARMRQDLGDEGKTGQSWDLVKKLANGEDIEYDVID